MLVADVKIIEALDKTPVYDDEYMPAFDDFVNVRVQQRPDLHANVQFFVPLSLDALFQAFPLLQPAARKLPFAALVLEQNDFLAVEYDAFDGDGKPHAKSTTSTPRATGSKTPENGASSLDAAACALSMESNTPYTAVPVPLIEAPNAPLSMKPEA